jgi:hypothetical protein
MTGMVENYWRIFPPHMAYTGSQPMMLPRQTMNPYQLCRHRTYMEVLRPRKIDPPCMSCTW